MIKELKQQYPIELLKTDSVQESVNIDYSKKIIVTSSSYQTKFAGLAIVISTGNIIIKLDGQTVFSSLSATSSNNDIFFYFKKNALITGASTLYLFPFRTK